VVLPAKLQKELSFSAAWQLEAGTALFGYDRGDLERVHPVMSNKYASCEAIAKDEFAYYWNC
jgi:hypothetical protein